MNSGSGAVPDGFWATDNGEVAARRDRNLVELLGEAVFHLDPSGRFVAINDAMAELAGRPRADILGDPLAGVFAADDVEAIEREIGTLKASHEESASLQVHTRSGDGRVVPTQTRLSATFEDGEFRGTMGVIRELSGKNATPEPAAPLPVDDTLGTVLDKIHGGIFVLDDAFEVVWADERIGEYFGVDPESLIGQDKREIVTDVIKERVDDPDGFARRVLASYDSNTSIDQFTCTVTAGGGREQRWLEHWSKPIEAGRYEGGRIEIYTEITDRRETADALQETADRFNSLVDAVEEYAIFRIDTEGHVRSWNEGAKQIKGYEPGEILGEHISTFYTEADRAAGVPGRNLATATEQDSVEKEGWRVRKDGSRFWATVTITSLRDDDGTHQGYLKVTRDMTDRQEREQELESELRRTLSRISDGFYAVDRDWRFTHVNERAEELLQHPREELLGESLRDMFPQAADTIVWDQCHEAMETQEPVSFELEYDTLDIWVEATAYPSESGLSVYFQDITERLERQRQVRDRERQLREHKEYTDRILDTIDDLFYVVDESGTFLRWNESLSSVTGYDDAEIESMDPLEFVAEEDREKVASGIATVFETGNTRIEATIQTKNGQEIPMEFTASAVETPDGETVLAGIGRDITARIERERALEASNERLEQFAHAASHDLQEPLRMVSSYLRLIERRYEDQLDEDGREFLEFAVDGADRMRDMIDGLLAYSRVESKGGPLEPVELDPVLADVSEDLRVAIDEHDAEITSDPLPEVAGDSRQLRQLFQNLLDNAIEYSGDGPPRIHVSAARPATDADPDRPSTARSGHEDQWIISVRDEGIGVDSDDQERIFQVFQSLNESDDRSSGIGLALCKRIVEHHGGEIRIDSTAGEGTTVSFTLSAAGSDDD